MFPINYVRLKLLTVSYGNFSENVFAHLTVLILSAVQLHGGVK